METIQTDSRQAILNAAEVIVARAGYAGLSMRELSRESGLAKSTLYHYFHDKHDIYLSMLERDMILIQERITAAAQSDEDVVGRLRAVVRTHFGLLSGRGNVAFHALRRAGALDEQLCALFRRHRMHIVEPIAAIIEQGVEEGIFRPVDAQLTVMSIFGMINGFYAQRLIFGEESSQLERIEGAMVEHTLSLLLDGIRN